MWWWAGIFLIIYLLSLWFIIRDKKVEEPDKDDDYTDLDQNGFI